MLERRGQGGPLMIMTWIFGRDDHLTRGMERVRANILEMRKAIRDAKAKKHPAAAYHGSGGVMGDEVVSDHEAAALAESFDRSRVARLLFPPHAPVNAEAQRVFCAALTGFIAADPHRLTAQCVSDAMLAVHIAVTWGATYEPVAPSPDISPSSPVDG